MKIIAIILFILLAFNCKTKAQDMTKDRLDSLSDREIFIKYNFPEAKDGCKEFLTLIVGVLVFTLTFSEKIVNFQKASRLAKGVLVLGWIFFIFSIILCGLALGELFWAIAKAANSHEDYGDNEQTAMNLIIASGSFFILGLTAIIFDAVVTIFHKSRASAKKSA